MPEKELALNKFGTGAIASKRDARDYLFHPAMRGASQPFDWELGFDIDLLHAYRLRCATEAEFYGANGREGWGYDRYKQIVDECKRKGISPKRTSIYDQNGSGSCTGQGMAKYLTVLDMIEIGKWDDASAKDIYPWVSVGFGQGAHMRDAIDRGCRIGAAKESLIPSYKYVNGVKKAPDEAFMYEKPPVTGEVELQRKKLQGKAYAGVMMNGDWMDNIAWSMLLNFGVFFAVGGDDEGNWDDKFPQLGEYAWGHALFGGRAKLFSGKRHTGHDNSWGTSIGDRGQQWLSEDWYKLNGGGDGWAGWRGVLEAWTMIDKSNSFITMQTNSKVIKLVYPDGTSELGVFDPATNPPGFISTTRNRAIEIPLKADIHGVPNNDVQWDKLKIDGIVYMPAGSAVHSIAEAENLAADTVNIPQPENVEVTPADKTEEIK